MKRSYSADLDEEWPRGNHEAKHTYYEIKKDKEYRHCVRYHMNDCLLGYHTASTDLASHTLRPLTFSEPYMQRSEKIDIYIYIGIHTSWKNMSIYIYI